MYRCTHWRPNDIYRATDKDVGKNQQGKLYANKKGVPENWGRENLKRKGLKRKTQKRRQYEGGTCAFPHPASSQVKWRRNKTVLNALSTSLGIDDISANPFRYNDIP